MSNSRPEGSKTDIGRRAVGLFHPYRWHAAALLALVSTTVALSLYSLTILAGLVGEMTSDDGTRAGLLRGFLIYGGIIVAGALLSVIESYTNQLIGQGVMHRLRSSLHDHLQRVSIRFFTSTRTGEILSRVGTDVNGIQQSVTGTFTDFLTNFLTLVIAFGIMLTIEWRLALATLVILPLWVYPTMRVGQAMRRLMREWHDEMGEMTAQLEETLSVSGSMLVKSFGRADHEREKFEQSNDNLRSLSIRRMKIGRAHV